MCFNVGDFAVLRRLISLSFVVGWQHGYLLDVVSLMLVSECFCLQVLVLSRL